MSTSPETVPVPPEAAAGFVAVNYITCQANYRERFEQLFATRARAIDRMPGFVRMEVLRPNADGESYLIVSHWTNRAAFEAWAHSPEFAAGHQRGFADLRQAREAGAPAPLTSRFITYDIVAH